MMEIGWYTIKEIAWYTMMEIRHFLLILNYSYRRTTTFLGIGFGLMGFITLYTACSPKLNRTLSTTSSTQSESAAIVTPLLSQLVLSGPTTLLAGTCEAFSVALKDADQDPFVATSDLSVTLSPSATFYSDSNCSSALPSDVLVIASSESPNEVFLKNNIAQTLQTSAAISDYQKAHSLSPDFHTPGGT
jgi:hypothetical protein